MTLLIKQKERKRSYAIKYFLQHSIGWEATWRDVRWPPGWGMWTRKTKRTRVFFRPISVSPFLSSMSAFLSFKIPTQSILYHERQHIWHKISAQNDISVVFLKTRNKKNLDFLHSPPRLSFFTFNRCNLCYFKCSVSKKLIFFKAEVVISGIFIEKETSLILFAICCCDSSYVTFIKPFLVAAANTQSLLGLSWKNSLAHRKWCVLCISCQQQQQHFWREKDENLVVVMSSYSL